MKAHELEKTITEFEREVEHIKSTGEIYDQFPPLLNTLTACEKSLEDNANEIDKLIEKYAEINEKNDSLLKNIEDSFAEIKNNQQKQYDELQKALNEYFEKAKDELAKDIKDGNARCSKSLQDISDICENIKKDQANAYRDLEELLKSRIEKLRLDIEVSVRDGNENVKSALEKEIDAKYIQFENLTNKQSEELKSAAKKNFIITCVVAIMAAAAVVVQFIV